MKKSLIILTALFMIACGKAQTNPQTFPEQTQASNGVLIIFYDKSETSTEQILSEGKKWHIELVYDYKSLNGLAVRVPDLKNIEEIKTFYQQRKGVLSVENDQINELH